MIQTSKSRGYTLVEIMISLAILAIIAAIAVPAYNGYIREARLSTLRTNIDTLRLPLEDFRLDNGNYGTAGTTYTNGALATQFGWEPNDGEANYSYSVRVLTNSYDIWASDSGSGVWVRCDDRMSTCCDGIGAVSACP